MSISCPYCDWVGHPSRVAREKDYLRRHLHRLHPDSAIPAINEIDSLRHGSYV